MQTNLQFKGTPYPWKQVGTMIISTTQAKYAPRYVTNAPEENSLEDWMMTTVINAQNAMRGDNPDADMAMLTAAPEVWEAAKALVDELPEEWQDSPIVQKLISSLAKAVNQQ